MASYVQLSEIPLHQSEHLALSKRPLIGEAEAVSKSHRDAQALGQPCERENLHLISLLSLFGSFLCAAAGFLSISPQLNLAFRLGYNLQLTVLGLLLSLQTVCLRRISQRFFLVIEREWGSSILQNFEAIRTNSILANHASNFWRLALLAFNVMPLLLSIGYKQFSGGTASTLFSTTLFPEQNYYGMVGVGDNELGGHLGLTIMANITTPFLAGTKNSPDLPPQEEFPLTFGLNTLVISANETAILDIPSQPYLAKLQSSLGPQESLRISARVNATVTIYNQTLDYYRGDYGFWNGKYDVPPISQVKSLDSYAFWFLGFLAWDFLGTDSYTSCMLAFIYAPANVTIDFNADFEATSDMFTTTRRTCYGTWEVTATSIGLIDGRCTDELFTNFGHPNDFSGLAPSQWYIPTLQDYLASYALAPRNTSVWKIPTMNTVVAAMWWSRMAGLFYNSTSGMDFYGYEASEESIVKTRAAVKDPPAIYVLIAFQSILSLFFLLGSYCYNSTPISDDFNVTAILASIDVSSLRLFKGAGLSGKLRRRVRLDVSIRHSGHPDARAAELVCTVDGKPSGDSVYEKLNSRSGMEYF